MQSKLARTTDPHTSHAAVESISESKRQHAFIILRRTLAEAKDKGLTADEVYRLNKDNPVSVDESFLSGHYHARLKDLENRGEVVCTGKTRKNPGSRKSALIWKLVEYSTEEEREWRVAVLLPKLIRQRESLDKRIAYLIKQTTRKPRPSKIEEAALEEDYDSGEEESNETMAELLAGLDDLEGNWE